MTDADTVREQARGELDRRGTTAAGVVCAVQDGAEWQQRFVDQHRPDAVRILAVPHAVEQLATVSRAVFGPGTAAHSEWLGRQAHTCKHGDPDQVLTALRALDVAEALDAQAATRQVEARTYFEKRRPQLADADFRARGSPIGSGAVESANKLVVAARLKGSGMHWQRATVSPMVSLRALLWSDRWTVEGPARGRAHLAASPRRRPRPAPGADALTPAGRVTTSSAGPAPHHLVASAASGSRCAAAQRGPSPHGRSSLAPALPALPPAPPPPRNNIRGTRAPDRADQPEDVRRPSSRAAHATVAAYAGQLYGR